MRVPPIRPAICRIQYFLPIVPVHVENFQWGKRSGMAFEPAFRLFCIVSLADTWILGGGWDAEWGKGCARKSGYRGTWGSDRRHRCRRFSLATPPERTGGDVGTLGRRLALDPQRSHQLA